MIPIIGITPDFDDGTQPGGERGSEPRYFLYERYVASVEQAGGVPLILPYVTDLAAVSRLLGRVDGLIITGGAFDVDPAYYGEAWQVPQGVVKTARTRFEMAVTLEALRRDMPLLGICGGEQNLNVVLKGTLYQDILEQVPGANNHERKDTDDPLHQITLVPGTLLHKIVGEASMRVNSSHHQAVRELGEGLRVNARSEDGIIEGIESSVHRFVVGVQWHPETLAGTGRGSRRIFEALVHEAGKTSS
jgi:putative glutamine amidotransferase